MYDFFPRSTLLDQNKFYSCFFSLEDHERLCKTLKKHQHRFKFLLTYDNCSEIREMYDWCISLQDNEWNYTINRTDDQKNGLKLEHGYQSERRKGKEVFIANYDLQKPARFTPLQLSLFDVS